MKKIKRQVRTTDSNSEISDKLDSMVRLLQDTFIFQALRSGVGRESIRKMLGVHPTRISKINQGLRKNNLK